ncbi:hypothetical protein DVH05_004259 [Phytophthora capsici]|nr:hypothetical protein DVH05_004259 [Phytophthora capsici]
MRSASFLKALEAELADQVEESRRPPFETVEAIGDHVDSSDPKPGDASSLRMCVARITDQPKLVRLELIDGAEANNVDKIMEALDKLDSHRRSKFVFSLTAWKPKFRSLYDNPMYFQAGGVYLFPKVHGLRRYFNLLQGSTQLSADSPPERVYPTSSRDNGSAHEGIHDGVGVPGEKEDRPEQRPGHNDTETDQDMGSGPLPTSRRGVLRRRTNDPEAEETTCALSPDLNCGELNPSPLKRSRAVSRSSVK